MNRLGGSYIIGPQGERLDVSRMPTTGTPYLGTAPLVPDQELMDNSFVYYRFGYGTFRTSAPRQKIFGRTYGELMEAFHNSQVKLVVKSNPEIRPDGEVLTYVEWLELYRASAGQQIPPRSDTPEEPLLASQSSPNKFKILPRSKHADQIRHTRTSRRRQTAPAAGTQ